MKKENKNLDKLKKYSLLLHLGPRMEIFFFCYNSNFFFSFLFQCLKNIFSFLFQNALNSYRFCRFTTHSFLFKMSSKDYSDKEKKFLESKSYDVPKALLDEHPALEVCEIDECFFCGIRDCPNASPEHHWHDGCPSCYLASPPVTSAAGVTMNK